MTTSDAAPTIETLTITQFRESDGMADWPVLADGATTFFRTGSFADSARLVRAIAGLPGIEAHRPDVDVRADGVTVRLVTYTDMMFGMSSLDVELARGINRVAAELGLTPDSSIVQSVAPIVIGARDIDAIRPFWQALLGYELRADSPEQDIIDPRFRAPGVWFEEMDEWTEGRNRIHLAVWVPYAQAEARVAATVAAGGRIIFERPPAWWTLVDPEGNEADIATSMDRD
jgi:4a-hydroxytetrahydrobiopterin dehydratase